MINKTNLQHEISKIDEPFQPVKIAEANGQIIRIALVRGEYHWHKHSYEDELFYLLKGELTIQLKEEDVVLTEGEMAVIPRGVEHCPRSDKESYILMFEPIELKSRGD